MLPILLTGAVESIVTKVQDTLRTPHHRIVQTAKRKEETLQRQFPRTRALAFPGGEPQERALGMAVAFNRHGLSPGDRLLDDLPRDLGHHYLIAP